MLTRIQNQLILTSLPDQIHINLLSIICIELTDGAFQDPWIRFILTAINRLFRFITHLVTIAIAKSINVLINGFTARMLLIYALVFLVLKMKLPHAKTGIV